MCARPLRPDPHGAFGRLPAGSERAGSSSEWNCSSLSREMLPRVLDVSFAAFPESFK